MWTNHFILWFWFQVFGVLPVSSWSCVLQSRGLIQLDYASTRPLHNFTPWSPHRLHTRPQHITQLALSLNVIQDTGIEPRHGLFTSFSCVMASLVGVYLECLLHMWTFVHIWLWLIGYIEQQQWDLFHTWVSVNMKFCIHLLNGNRIGASTGDGVIECFHWVVWSCNTTK